MAESRLMVKDIRPLPYEDRGRIVTLVGPFEGRYDLYPYEDGHPTELVWVPEQFNVGDRVQVKRNGFSYSGRVIADFGDGEYKVDLDRTDEVVIATVSDGSLRLVQRNPEVEAGDAIKDSLTILLTSGYFESQDQVAELGKEWVTEWLGNMETPCYCRRHVLSCICP